jgi:type II secretory pathway pseudopilin PulG
MEKKETQTSPDPELPSGPPKRTRSFVGEFIVVAVVITLAFIAIQNLSSRNSWSRFSQATFEIKGIELALSKMLSDSGCAHLSELFNAQGVNAAVGRVDGGAPWTAEEFRKLQELYTATSYALLRAGRLSLEESYETSFGMGRFGDVLNHDVVKRLSTSYMELEFDPWGTMYQIFPGAWEGEFENHPIIFRTYTSYEEESGLHDQEPSRRDAFSFEIDDPDTGETITISYPASEGKPFYIYSLGANGISGQMMYRPDYEGVAPQELYEGQAPEYRGGGDDITSWVNDATWHQFY